ncbi:rCG24105 [Rattus norvegicus]|uniref:RCG24105 n=1 Tax=Rattus norvegicus TaxID=10116 RepID=A6KAJ6_RAT|nr:rCG24105 [Rattus norvegicus]
MIAQPSDPKKTPAFKGTRI